MTAISADGRGIGTCAPALGQCTIVTIENSYAVGFGWQDLQMWKAVRRNGEGLPYCFDEIGELTGFTLSAADYATYRLS
jgi:hypothetical protein